MSYRLKIVFLVCFVGVFFLRGHSAMAAWGPESIEKGWRTINDAETKSMEEKHEALLGIIGGLGPWAAYGEQSKYRNGAVRNKEQEELFLAARDLMISTPGHAEYYGQRIRKWRAYAQKYNNGESYSNYMRDRMYLIQVLEHLPSSETARVMAGFLDDDFERREPGGGRSLGAPNMVKAARVLVSILDNPPTTEIYRTSVWRQWCQEVEAGQTTFRLKGIEGEFNFQGPTEAKAPRERKTDAEIEAAQARVAEGSDGAADVVGGVAEPEGRSRWAWIVVGVAVLLAALVYLGLTKAKWARG